MQMSELGRILISSDDFDKSLDDIQNKTSDQFESLVGGGGEIIAFSPAVSELQVGCSS